MTVLASESMVLRPLTKATEQALEPLDLSRSRTVYLLVSIEKAGEFLLRPRNLTTQGVEIKSGWFPPAVVDSLVALPERRVQKGTRYDFEVPITDVNVLLIHGRWPVDRIKFVGTDGAYDEEAELTFRNVLTSFLVQSNRAAVVARFKLTGELPSDPNGDLDDASESMHLSPYQQVGVHFITQPQSAGLFFDRGTGKTATAVRSVCVKARRKTDGMLRALIVCPPQVRMNWGLEFERFADVPGKVTIVRGTLLARLKRLTEAATAEADCYWSAAIIAYDSIASSLDHLKWVPWDLIIADESQWFKSSATKRWKVMRDLRECAKHRVILSGSPIGNSIVDLWTQLEFLMEGGSGFKTLKAFKNFHGHWEPSGQPGVERLVANKNVALLQERLTRMAFSITKVEAKLDIGEKAYTVVEVEMGKEQAKLYDELLSKLEVEISQQYERTDLPRSVINQNVLTKLLRLAQVTSGHLGLDRSPEGVKPPPLILEQNPKLEALIDLLKNEYNDPLSKVIVWCCWVPDLVAIQHRLSEEGIGFASYYGATSESARQVNERRFNEDPKCRVFVANPQTAAEGLNLVGYDWWNGAEATLKTNTEHVIFYSQNWSALLRGQAEDRAHRKGTRVKVFVTDLVVPGTIDEEIRGRVNGKLDMAESLLDVNEILKSVLRH